MRCWISVPLILRIEDSGPGPSPRLSRASVRSSVYSSAEKIDLEFGNLAGEIGVADDWLALIEFDGGDLAQALDSLLGAGDAGDAGALVGEQVFGVGPAFIFLADEVGDGDFHVGEPGLVDLMPAIHGDDWTDFDAGRLHVDEDEGDAFLRFLRGWVGAAEHEDPVGEVTERGPGFLAVDDVVIADALGLGFQRGEVGAGSRVRSIPGTRNPCPR